MSDTKQRAESTDLVGNRWVLVGGVVYLLEWVAIIGASAAGLGSVVTRGVGRQQRPSAPPRTTAPGPSCWTWPARG